MWNNLQVLGQIPKITELTLGKLRKVYGASREIYSLLKKNLNRVS